MTSKLESLPLEVLHQIFGHFCVHCQETTTSDLSYLEDRHTLYDLSLVSNRIRYTAQLVLHHESLVPIRIPLLHRQRRRLGPFLRTVTSRPDLAMAVKTLYIDERFAGNLDMETARPTYEQALQALGTNSNSVWSKRRMSSKKRRHPDIRELETFLVGHPASEERVNITLNTVAVSEILVVLLALLPNLQCLIVDGSSFKRYLSKTTFDGFGLNTLSLRSLHARFLPLALLDIAPYLENVSVRAQDPIRRDLNPRTVHYSVYGNSFEQDEIEEVLDSYKQPLSTFIYEPETDERPSHILQPSLAISLLDRFHTSLRSLHLDLRFRTFPDGVTAHVKPMPIPSLKKFGALEEIFISLNTIFGGDQIVPKPIYEHTLVEYLPESIISVTAVKTNTLAFPHHLQKGLIGFADAKKRDKTIFPHLKLVRCDSRHVCNDTITRGLLKQVGVALVYQEFPRPGRQIFDP
ncbi:hypothetical protein FSARC_6416 [Fusarium sarcochroum]|uniref:Uncharacterized protein n=1 Tax=Fusarium sarcochroum TaxID=1208366 RepID=A0A8H4X8E1_9HYPO|nr:hypothetical protein FSARC_6416 [Fusarium sarcochroum]